MEQNGVKSDRPLCPYCGSISIWKNGSTHHKKPKFKCKECGRQFIENPQKKLVIEEKKQQVKKLLLERISLRGITPMFGNINDLVTKIY